MPYCPEPATSDYDLIDKRARSMSRHYRLDYDDCYQEGYFGWRSARLAFESGQWRRYASRSVTNSILSLGRSQGRVQAREQLSSDCSSFSAPESDPVRVVEVREARSDAAAWMRNQPDSDCWLLTERQDGRTWTDLGRAMGCSESRVRRAYGRLLSDAAKALRGHQ